MPAAARISDPTSHMAAPLAPGAGSVDVEIGFLPAWRALPQGMGAGIESALTTMKKLVDAASLSPMTTPVELAKVNAGLTQEAGRAAPNGMVGAPAAVAGGFASLMTTNAALTAAYTAAAAVPGGEPAARAAYTLAIKAAAAAFAASAVSGIAGMTDTHVCPQPAGPIPHGPGVVTRGSRSVLINNLPACRQGDQLFEAAGGADPIKKGIDSVLIGDDVGAPGSASESAVDEAAIERQAQARSTIAALRQAASAATPLIEICPQCARLSETSRRPKHRVGFVVVIDETGEAVSGVELDIALPDGSTERHTTDPQGRVDIDDLDAPGVCSVHCRLSDARVQETFKYIGMGAARLTPVDPADGPGTRPHPATGGVIARVMEHRVRTGDTLESLARSCGMTWQQLALFNWGTSAPGEINRHLRDFVGCTQMTADGRSYMFSSADEPGIVYLPRAWSEEGLPTGVDHIIRVRSPRTRLRRLIITLLDADDQPRPGVLYELTVGEKTYRECTDAGGRIDQLVPVEHQTGTLLADGQRVALQLNQLESAEEAAGVRKRLNNLGYQAGRAGDADAQTSEALRAFQRRHELEATGECDESTRARLKEVYGH